jgi:lysophospholipase L1-like esterase
LSEQVNPTPPPLKRPKKWAFALIVTLLFFSALEGAAWFIERQAYLGTFSPQNTPQDILYIDKGDGRPHLRPGAQLSGSRFEIHINSLGFRGPDLVQPRTDQTRRIWFVGGSTTFDIYAPTDRETWPARVGESLQAAWPDRKVEVINAGVPGEVLRGNREDFESFFAQVGPDILVIHAGPNDLRSAAMHVTGLEPDPEPRLVERLAFFRVLSRKLRLQHIPSSWKGREIETHFWDRMDKDLRDFVGSARKKRMTVLLATHAHRAEDAATGRQAAWQVAESSRLLKMDGESVIAAYARYNEMVRQVAADLQVPLVDLRSVIPPEEGLFGDHTHFSPSGSARVAAAVAATIQTLK